MDNKDLAKQLSGNYTCHGIQFNCQVSPCCWMYDSAFQFEWKAFDGRCKGFILTKTPLPNATSQMIIDLLQTELKQIPCDVCGEPNFININEKPNTFGSRGKTCEKCFIIKLNKEFEISSKKEEQREAKQDAKMKKKGFKFKTIAWVHPEAGGDDYQVLYYTTVEMTDKQIQTKLKKEGSRVITDYKTITL